jgi:hypothetical protein
MTTNPRTERHSVVQLWWEGRLTTEEAVAKLMATNLDQNKAIAVLEKRYDRGTDATKTAK